MELVSPPSFMFLGFLPGWVLSLIITLTGLVIFALLIFKRLMPLLKAAPDKRFDRIPQRVFNFIKIQMLQYRQPRYMVAGILHILIFFGFLILGLRTMTLVFVGLFDGFYIPFFDGTPWGNAYYVAKDYTATIVFIVCFIAAIRRGIFTPERYNVPEKYGKGHTGEAVLVLCIIMGLMVSESFFEAADIAAGHAVFAAPLTLVWFFKNLLHGASSGSLQTIHVVSYYIHDFLFFFFLCFLPLGKHFHVITSWFNVLFMRLDKGNVKPVMHGVSDEKLDELESFGVKKLEDFTWKHMLDFYSCADCGRCSDQCPANAVKRPLSPRFISIKARDLIFKNYPVLGKMAESKPLIEDIYEEDEIWSCTTCGACEEECPLGIEYIDKMVDLRRGMVDEGIVPQSLQKPLSAIEKRGNPWGKMEKNRADWTTAEGFDEECQVKILDGKDTADTLYFVDSISSFDDRMQDIARATSKVLAAAGIDFGILGKNEKDSGHEVRRFGEEMLFQDIKDHNIDMIMESDVKHIVTADPHAYNALKNDYDEIPPVEHISQVITRNVTSGKLQLKDVEDTGKVYVYHDPCYLGRHNGMYEDPREAIDAIPGLTRVEMKKSRDRSFCCGGGGLMLFYEPEEEQRMGVLRVQMAAEVGANVIVTACPFCLVNIEDAIKVAGMEGKIEAIELAELIDKHIIR